MNNFVTATGGSPIKSTYLELISDSANSGITIAVKSQIDPEFYNYNIYLEGTVELISGGTSAAYAQISDGAVWMNGKVLPISAQIVQLPMATTLSGLYINAVSASQNAAVYKDLSTHYNFQNELAMGGTSGTYTYLSFKPLSDVIKTKTSDTVTVTATDNFDATIADNTSYFIITGSNLDGASTITLPAIDTTTNGKELTVKMTMSCIPGVPTLLIKDANGATIESLTTSISTAGPFNSVRTYKNNAGTWILKDFINDSNALGTAMRKVASTLSISNYTDCVTPQAMLSTYPTTTTVEAFGPVNVTSPTVFYITGLTNLSSKTIYGIQGSFTNNAGTIGYTIPKIDPIDLTTHVYVEQYYPATNVYKINFQDSFAGFTAVSGYIVITHSV